MIAVWCPVWLELDERQYFVCNKYLGKNLEFFLLLLPALSASCPRRPYGQVSPYFYHSSADGKGLISLINY
jgi:hypothetical protein